MVDFPKSKDWKKQQYTWLDVKSNNDKASSSLCHYGFDRKTHVTILWCKTLLIFFEYICSLNTFFFVKKISQKKMKLHVYMYYIFNFLMLLLF